MERTTVSELRTRIGQQVCVKGFVEAIREHKERLFIVIRDRTGSVQVLSEREGSPTEAIVMDLTRESAVVVTGLVIDNPQVRLGGLEIVLETLQVVGAAAAPLPLETTGRSRPGVEHRLDWRHLDLRRPEMRRVFEIQTLVERAMRRFWEAEGLIEIHAPKLMGTASESGAELFGLDYFDTTAYLAQSPQFYKQMAIAAGFEGVFEIGPVFRAEPSFTTRHTTEFTSVDVEISWVDSHEDVMVFEERWMHAVLEEVSGCAGGTEVNVPTLPFPRISHAAAVEIARTRQPGWEPSASGDLDPAGERLVARHAAEELGHEFVFVTDYPVSVRPFYHMRHPSAPELTRSFDLLWKGIEITTGAQREHRIEILEAQATEKRLGLDGLASYLGFFRFGCPPHGGFGFGLARMLMVLLDQPSVRETTLLPRTPNRLVP